MSHFHSAPVNASGPCGLAKVAALEKEEEAGWPGCNPLLIKTKLKELKNARAKLDIKDGKQER